MLSQLITQENLYASERGQMPIEDLVEQMRAHDITISPTNGGAEFAVTFSASDARQAKRVTQKLASALVDAKAGEILDWAGPPSRSDTARRLQILFAGLGIGLSLGLLAALFTGLCVWKLAAEFGIGGLLLTLFPWCFVPDLWSSRALISIGAASTAAPPDLRQVIEEASSALRLEAVAKDLGIEKKWLRAHLQISVMKSSGIVISVQYEDKDRNHANQVTAKFAQLLIDAGSSQGLSLKLLDPASLPADPSYPNRAIPALIGLFLGISGAVAVGMRRRGMALAA